MHRITVADRAPSGSRAPGRLGRAALIEDTRRRRQVDVFALREQRSYTAVRRSRRNVAFRRG